MFYDDYSNDKPGKLGRYLSTTDADGFFFASSYFSHGSKKIQKITMSYEDECDLTWVRVDLL